MLTRREVTVVEFVDAAGRVVQRWWRDPTRPRGHRSATASQRRFPRPWLAEAQRKGRESRWRRFRAARNAGQA